MIDFIAVKDFAFYYHTLVMLFVLLTFLDANQVAMGESANLKKKNLMGVILMTVVVLFLGLRPITFSHFGDMGMYNVYFENYVAGEKLNTSKDIGFEVFIYLCSKMMTAQMFFLLCAFLYIFPLYKACKRLFQEYWYYAFLMLLASFSFWGYGTNGIRNGLATSFFIYALSIDKKWLRFALIALSVSFHGSLLVPTAVYILTLYYKNTRHYLYFWLLAIPLSVVLGGFWESFFLGFGFGEEERLEGYLTEIGEFDEKFSQTGFRWDFVLYSAAGVLMGWYFVLKRQYQDEFYRQLFNIYLVTNGFWILVIRANFSNRFAYLSWFILGILMVYPFLRNKFFEDQHKILGRLILVYFAFTYLLNVILA